MSALRRQDVPDDPDRQDQAEGVFLLRDERRNGGDGMKIFVIMGTHDREFSEPLEAHVDEQAANARMEVIKAENKKKKFRYDFFEVLEIELHGKND